jgi:hypothetical protein
LFGAVDLGLNTMLHPEMAAIIGYEVSLGLI